MGDESTPGSSREPLRISVEDTPGVSLKEDLTARDRGPGMEAVRRITSDDWAADLADGLAFSGTVAAHRTTRT
jgi:hypothetical protein